MKIPDFKAKFSSMRQRVDRARGDVEARVAKALGHFGVPEVIDGLRRIGVRRDDTLMVHVGFDPRHGFSGTPMDLSKALCDAVGPAGTIVMMTMPYPGEGSRAWLATGETFDARRSVSRMGVVTEVFRRSPDVRRSVHPTHPVAAWGALRDRFTADTDDPAPFGPKSPFGTLVEVGGKVLLFDVPFRRMSFQHYLEHHIQHVLPVPLYRPPVEVEVIDHDRARRLMRVRALTDEIDRRRSTPTLERALRRDQVLREGRLSLATLTLADTRAMVLSVDERVARGWRFHRGWELPGR